MSTTTTLLRNVISATIAYTFKLLSHTKTTQWWKINKWFTCKSHWREVEQQQFLHESLSEKSTTGKNRQSWRTVLITNSLVCLWKSLNTDKSKVPAGRLHLSCDETTPPCGKSAHSASCILKSSIRCAENMQPPHLPYNQTKWPFEVLRGAWNEI